MITIHHLETDITQACQLSCVACNHHVPLWRAKGPTHADVEVIEDDLNHFSKIAHAQVWGALGGEPLLHPRLSDVLKIVRASGACDKIEVWTNGLLLERMRKEFWSLFDELVLSVYPNKHTSTSLEWIEKTCKDHGVTLRVMDESRYPNFKTLLEKEPTGAEATKAKFAGCFFRHFSRVLNAGYFYTCCCAPHMPVLIQNRPKGSDGVRIKGLSEAKLKAYLERTEPLGACSICAGRDTAVNLTWSEERDPVLWMKKSMGAEA